MLSLFNPYLVVQPLNVRDLHVVGGGADVLILLVGEDVKSYKVNLENRHSMTG